MIRRRTTSLTATTTSDAHTNYITLPYIGDPSTKIYNILRGIPTKDKTKISFKTTSSLGLQFFNNKDRTDEMDKCGVYQLSCGECDAKYIGKTYRHFKTRLKEHKNAIRVDNTRYHFADHINSTGHKHDENLGMKMIRKYNSNQQIVKWEALEIFRAKKTGVNLLNQQDEFEISDMLRYFEDNL